MLHADERAIFLKISPKAKEYKNVLKDGRIFLFGSIIISVFFFHKCNYGSADRPNKGLC